jgi:mono/diheme cytochrome c family protein
MKFPVLSLVAAVAFSASLASAQEPAFDLKASAERGKPLYLQTCIACHQPTGMGLPGAFPPLGGSEYATGSPRRMIAIMLKGMQGPLTVKGVTYNNIMLALDLQFPIYKDDAKVADVANYVRTSFGNTVTEAITPQLVAEVRAKWAARTTAFTEADIKDWKDDAAPAQQPTAASAPAPAPAVAAEPAK